jgi:hypothetical protein
MKLPSNPAHRMNPLSQLPNYAGFIFTGILHDNSDVRCVVVIRDNIHMIVDFRGNSIYSTLKGWRE